MSNRLPNSVVYRRLMLASSARRSGLGRVVEIAEVLSVHERQVHTHGRRLRLQRVGDGLKHRHTGRAVVGAGDRHALLARF